MWDLFIDPKIRENAELRKIAFEIKLQMDIVKELADNLEHYINQHYDNIAPVGQYERLDREREQELELVKRAREWLKAKGE